MNVTPPLPPFSVPILATPLPPCRCTTVDWGLLAVLAPLPSLAAVSLHYFQGRGNNGHKVGARGGVGGRAGGVSEGLKGMSSLCVCVWCVCGCVGVGVWV